MLFVSYIISGCSAVGSAGGLGPSGRGFEPLHSDQKLSEISDFRELFLFLVYCGAMGEGGCLGNILWEILEINVIMNLFNGRF